METLLRVEGRVQGVGFRLWTRAVANELGVQGWVRNLPDGSVEVGAAGSEDAIERLVARLHDGPAHAEVRTVRHEPLPEGSKAPPQSGFEIRG